MDHEVSIGFLHFCLSYLAGSSAHADDSPLESHWCGQCVLSMKCALSMLMCSVNENLSISGSANPGGQYLSRPSALLDQGSCRDSPLLERKALYEDSGLRNVYPNKDSYFYAKHNWVEHISPTNFRIKPHGYWIPYCSNYKRGSDQPMETRD